jgi:hypothetical protein
MKTRRTSPEYPAVKMLWSNSPERVERSLQFASYARAMPFPRGIALWSTDKHVGHLPYGHSAPQKFIAPSYGEKVVMMVATASEGLHPLISSQWRATKPCKPA